MRKLTLAIMKDGGCTKGKLPKNHPLSKKTSKVTIPGNKIHEDVKEIWELKNGNIVLNVITVTSLQDIVQLITHKSFYRLDLGPCYSTPMIDGEREFNKTVKKYIDGWLEIE